MNMKNLQNQPFNPSGGELIWKTVIGLFIWLLIAFLVFIKLMIFGWIFEEAERVAMWTGEWVNPMLSIIILIIAFIWSLIWNLIILLVYNLLFSDKYYDLGKMIWLVAITNILMLFIIAPLYIVFYNNVETLYFILAFHILFGVFISYNLMEISTNPNYAGVHIVGTTIALSISVLIFSFFYKWADPASSGLELLLIVPPIIWFLLTPIIHWLREKVYYKFYEMWNNFLYIPSVEEVLVDQEEEEEINIDDKNL